MGNQLNTYKINYKNDLMTCLNSADSSAKMFHSTEFNMQMLYKFIDLYELEYPERKQAFFNFFRKTDNLFSAHIARIKCMSYMLDEKVVDKMAGLMKKRNGIYIQLFSHPNPDIHGASAYFGRDFWRRPRIMYYDIEGKSRLNPPYKTFFHEFGHALDALTAKGWGFLSDRFRFTNCAEGFEISKDPSSRQSVIRKVKKEHTKTIHEWAAFDVENCIIQTALDLFSADAAVKSRRSYLHPGIHILEKYQMIDFVTHVLFLAPDGGKKLEGLSERPYVNELHDLYKDIAETVNTKILSNYKNMIVLPRDLFGGITNNQLGGGHSCGYWFKGKRRINKVSREAFAGYFEYKTTITDPDFQMHLLNPYHCMPNTILALEAMLNGIT